MIGALKRQAELEAANGLGVVKKHVWLVLADQRARLEELVDEGLDKYSGSPAWHLTAQQRQALKTAILGRVRPIVYGLVHEDLPVWLREFAGLPQL